MVGLFALIAHALVLGILLLVLHRLVPRYGFAPLLIALGALTMMLQSQLGLFFEISPSIVFFFSQVALIPPILAVVLVIYVANGAAAARMIVYCILGVSLLVLVLAQTYRWTLGLPEAQTTTPITIGAAMSYINFNPRILIGSIIAFTADMLVITIVYQGLRNLRIREWLVVGLALTAAFWTDFVIFSAIVDFGSPIFTEGIPGGLLTKTIAALILWLPIAAYLSRVAPQVSTFIGGDNRPLFDIFLNRLGKLEKALSEAVTAREQTLNERQREAIYYGQLVNNIDQALWLADADQQAVFFVNSAYERMWGRPAEDFIGTRSTFEESIHPEDRERVIVGYPQHARGDYTIEYRIIRPDGTTRWVFDRVFPIRDEAGVIYRYAGLSSDITELKRAEQERVQLAIEQERVRLLRDFVAEVTHDLKTPLSSIHLKLYQASKVDDQQKRAEVLDELGEQVDRIGSMISDMLTLSRLESLNELTMHRVNLNDVINEITRERFALAHKKDITLVENLAREPLSILADRDDLGRAIGNLIDNAIHYTPAGGRIEVESQLEDAQAVLVVRDTGIGIAEGDLIKIFDRFYRGENGRQADPGGTGLGLAIVKRVVDAHHGRINVTSVVGKGTTFRIALPLARNGVANPDLTIHAR